MTLFDSAQRDRIEALLPDYLPRCRWFRSKARPIASAKVEALAALTMPDSAEDFPALAIVRAEFRDGGSERYALPLTLATPETARDYPELACIGAVATQEGERIACDAAWDAGFRSAFFDLLAGQREAELDGGTLRGRPVAGGLPAGADNASKVLGAEQSNTSLRYDSWHFAKLYRKLDDGINPEPEVLRFLRESTDYRHVPEFASALEWVRPDAENPVTVALLVDFVQARGDAWEFTLKELAGAFAHGSSTSPEDLARVPETLVPWIRLLGRRTGELHAALASRKDVAAFAPEALTEQDLGRVRDGVRGQLEEALALLEDHAGSLPKTTADLAKKVVEGRARFEALLRGGTRQDLGAKIRTHGDLHLGQILITEDDARILDFEGEPGRPLAEARRKQSPLRDAAGMLRSFHYAAHTVAREAGKAGLAGDGPRLADALCELFLSGYLPAAATAGLPANAGARDAVLDLFVLEKAVYELLYELNNRPDWVEIPLAGLVALAETSSTSRS